MGFQQAKMLASCWVFPGWIPLKHHGKQTWEKHGTIRERHGAHMGNDGDVWEIRL